MNCVPISRAMTRDLDVTRLERQKRILYDLLRHLGVEEPDSTARSSAPLQELWGLVELCEDLLEAAETEDV